MQARARAYPAVKNGPLESVESQATQYRGEGFTHFQTKVGGGSGIDLDIARIRKAGECMRSGETLVIATYVSTYFSKLRYDQEAPMVVGGFLNTNEKPGLGVDPDLSVIGDPIRTYS